MEEGAEAWNNATMHDGVEEMEYLERSAPTKRKKSGNSVGFLEVNESKRLAEFEVGKILATPPHKLYVQDLEEENHPALFNSRGMTEESKKTWKEEGEKIEDDTWVEEGYYGYADRFKKRVEEVEEDMEQEDNKRIYEALSKMELDNRKQREAMIAEAKRQLKESGVSF